MSDNCSGKNCCYVVLGDVAVTNDVRLFNVAINTCLITVLNW